MTVWASPFYAPPAAGHMPEEPPLLRRICLAALLLLVAAYAVLLAVTWAPAVGGPDQNGYVVGAKQLARTGSTALTPRDSDGRPDPMQYVCKIWIPADFGTPQECYYPKYPAGFHLILAIAYAIGDIDAVYAVDPLAALAGFIGSYLLARRLLGSPGALVVVLLLASSVATHILGQNVKSHALSACLVVWGMYLAMRWLDHGRWRSALGAGFLLGTAVTIRYSEGLLLLPLLWVAAMRLRDAHWRPRREWLQTLATLALWATPGLLLLIHNLVAFRSPTGYDPTHESSGFYLNFLRRGFLMLWQHQRIEGIGSFYGIGLAGTLVAIIVRPRTGLLLLFWIWPIVVLHSTYYFVALADYGMHTRFVHSALPAIAICAVGLPLWVFRRLPGRWAKIAQYSVLLLAIAGIAAQSRQLPARIRDWHQERLRLQGRTTQLLAHLPPDAILLADTRPELNHLQAVSNLVLYQTTAWLPPKPIRAGVDAGQEAREIDTTRAQRIAEITSGKSTGELAAMRDTALGEWLSAGRPVYVYLSNRAKLPEHWPTAAESKLELLPVDIGGVSDDPSGLYQVLRRR